MVSHRQVLSSVMWDPAVDAEELDSVGFAAERVFAGRRQPQLDACEVLAVAERRSDEPPDVVAHGGRRHAGLVRERYANTGEISTAVRPGGQITAGRVAPFTCSPATPNRGIVAHVDSAGRTLHTVGTGRPSRHRNRVGINRIDFMPTDVEGVAPGSRILTFVIRG